MPIDYSKWKKIEVSDDEDDTHPNIDTPSLFRWRHQARLERMAEKKQKKEEIEKAKKTSTNKMKELEDKLAAATVDDDKKRLAKELHTLKDQEEKWLQKEKELEDAERLEPWNIDTIAHEAFSSSRINKIEAKKPSQEELDEEAENKRMTEFLETNEVLIQTYGHLKGGLKVSEEFLLLHPQIAHDYTASYLTIECLNFAIEIQKKEEEFNAMTKQTILLQYLLELARSLNGSPSNTTIIKAFFYKFSKAEDSYVKMYNDEIEGFRERLLIRAKQKKDAYLAEQRDQKAKRPLTTSPGQLDPQEVFDSLPEEMQQCFEAQDIPKLHEVANAMDREVFAYHFDRCIKSGLWVPAANQSENENENEETADESAAGSVTTDDEP